MSVVSLRDAVAEFLFREAGLADSHAYRDWLALWAPDALYHIPCNEDDADPETHVAIIHEGRAGLEDRVRRLSGNYAFAQQPRSRLSRIVGNIVVAEADGLVEARSTFNLTAFRRDVMEIFAGRQVHRLRREDGDFRIVAKTVYLVNNDGYIGNMTFLI